jgi:hypothetical protein
LPARDAREQEERRRYGAQARHSTAMHDVLSNRFASVVPTELSCSNRFAPTQSEPLGILLTRAYAITAVSARDVAMETPMSSKQSREQVSKRLDPDVLQRVPIIVVRTPNV